MTTTSSCVVWRRSARCCVTPGLNVNFARVNNECPPPRRVHTRERRFSRAAFTFLKSSINRPIAAFAVHQSFGVPRRVGLGETATSAIFRVENFLFYYTLLAYIFLLRIDEEQWARFTSCIYGLELMPDALPLLRKLDNMDFLFKGFLV